MIREEVEEFKTHIKKLISRNKLDEVIKKIEEYATLNKLPMQHFILISSKYHSYKKNSSSGLLDINDSEKIRSEISRSFIDFLDGLEHDDFIDLFEKSSLVKKLRANINSLEEQLKEKEVEVEGLNDLLEKKEEEYIKLLNSTNESSIQGLTIEKVMSLPITDLIEIGENQFIEFKSSISKVIYNSIIKTISAFLNTKGGVLLLGVSDDGSKIGLENISRRVIDDFELTIRRFVRAKLGVTATQLVLFDSHQVENELIVAITCISSSIPVFMEELDKNSMMKELFIVRSGSQNITIRSTRETLSYIDARYKK